LGLRTCVQHDEVPNLHFNFAFEESALLSRG
jgi:hypothetical protein